jgi:putative peptide zinc metalloprotease protein
MSQRPFLSASWYRVADLRPQLRGHTSVHRHRYRGKVWHVVQDHVSGRMYRLSPASFIVVGAMDGQRTVDRLWQEACALIGEEAPSQDDVVRLLAQLGAADLLQTEVAPDAAGLVARETRTRRRQRMQNVLNPLAFRIRIWDPDRFLERTLPLVRWLFGRFGAVLWLLVVLPAIVLAVQYRQALGADISGRILAADNAILLAACYVVLKAMHELGHAYAVKALGGAVHELGVMFLVLAPVPYVDASAASGFRRKWHRVLVGAAGMIVEVFLASLALYVWLAVEDGLVRAIAFNAMLIAGVSTVVFNINPLLRFDGYYMLSDAIEIPNLQQRANAYWAHLLDKHVFRVEHPTEIEADHRERLWLLLFAPASFLYRVAVMLAIAVFVASEYLVVGVLIAIWAIVLGLLLPIGKSLGAVLKGPRYERQRARTIAMVCGFALSVAAVVALVPVPSHTTTEGVVWLPESAVVRAQMNGFVGRLLAEPGQTVTVGQALVESEEPNLSADARTMRAQVGEIEARLFTERFTDRSRAEVTAIELRHVQGELANLAQRVERLTVRSRAAGTFFVSRPQDLPGRYLREGQEIGYVLPAGSRIVRATVSQEDFELVRNRLRHVRVRIAQHPDKTLPARIVREVPAGQGQLPSKALGEAGGGLVPVDPRDPLGRKIALRIFLVDLELPAEYAATAAFGSRVYVRFDHDWEPIGQQAWRRLRQLLLSRFAT